VQAGVTEELLDRVPTWRDHADFTDTERAALDYTERFCLDPDAIDDAYIEGLRDHFDDGQIVDLTAAIAKYLAIGRFVKVLELDHVCPLPERPTHSQEDDA
jgi:alkylhydroperoxidase family enzyme